MRKSGLGAPFMSMMHLEPKPAHWRHVGRWVRAHMNTERDGWKHMNTERDGWKCIT
jgi:hypothetical protein